MRHMKTVAITVSLMWIFAAMPGAADVIRLKDGTVLEGDVERVEGAWVVTAADGRVTRVEASQVKSLEGTSPSGGAAGSGTSKPAPHKQDEKLASLRRSVASLADLTAIIERYQRFIDTKPAQPTLAEAVKDLAEWK